MARYQVILSYDGTHFYGFQRLKSRESIQRTVQGVVEEALRQLDWQETAIMAAGRTDTGVHASGQVIAFNLDWIHSPDDLLSALNARLPSDVAAVQIQVVAPDFHPRYDAKTRLYRYRLFCQEMRNPMKERYAWRIWPPVDMEVLNQASRYLVGTHDFVALGRPLKAGASTVRTVIFAGWKTEGLFLVFQIAANAFLYHMVRRMVFLQVAIGQGKTPPEAVLNYLGESQVDDHSGQGISFSWKYRGLAPAHGLDLAKIYYRTIQADEFTGE
jgi:tRNA pseudouridine38-40 synthase